MPTPPDDSGARAAASAPLPPITVSSSMENQDLPDITKTIEATSRVVCLVVKQGIVTEVKVVTGPVFTEYPIENWNPNKTAILATYPHLSNVCGVKALIDLAKMILTL